MKKLLSLALLIAALGCSDHSVVLKQVAHDSTAKQPVPVNVKAGATEMYAKPQIPILCYHHIRPLKSNSSNDYVVSPSSFSEQIKALADSGYHTVLPAELENYYTFNKPLPAKPVMLTFDDTDLEQFTIAAAEMKKYGFKGVFFIMNISIGKHNYMSAEDIKTLAAEGHTIGAHTWDHHRVTDYNDSLWNKQLNEARAKLETITGKPIDYFAYPFGLWNKQAIPQLQSRDIHMAFQLSAKRDSTEPLYTVRRMIVPGTWTTKGLMKAMKGTFDL